MFPVCVCVSGDGVFGWRVEKMEAVQLDSTQLGMFFTGDAYIILNKHHGGADLHMWMGEESSPDEQCACAMLATQLYQFLGGAAVQYRQEQGDETDEFMQLFPNGVSYKRGGVDSGFRKVDAERVQVRRLYQVKGKKNIRVTEVELNWRSFNTGDCFILDLGQTIVSWSGCKSSVFERQKVHQIAAMIRDTERNGKAQICDVSQGEEPPEMIQVLGPIPVITDSSEEDSKADITNSASLYKVSGAVGGIRVADKAPFDQKLLQRDDCFILDNGANNKIFIWKGNGANEEKSKMALKMADEFIAQMCYCKAQTQVEILHQGRESVLFKHFFYSWS